jgi:hypothetical protein
LRLDFLRNEKVPYLPQAFFPNKLSGGENHGENLSIVGGLCQHTCEVNLDRAGHVCGYSMQIKVAVDMGGSNLS